eukprot:Skav230634  [mRNA]  locus=scaffold1673:268663:270629:+ [translate_table: standard]
MYPLKGLLTLTLLVAVRGVDLPDIVGYLTNPVAWFRGQLHDPLVHQPKKLMPTVHTLQHMTQHESEERLHFFMALFFVIFFTTIILGTVIMTVGPRMKACVGSSYHPLSSSRSGRVKRVSEEGHAVDLEWQRTLVAISFAATLTSCTATCIWSLRTSTLSKKTGLDWEMYALLLAGGGAAVLIQAIFAVRWLPKGQTFGIFAFAEGAFVVQVLLTAKASVEAKNVFGHTPLMIAAEGNRIEVAKLLLAARASPHLADNEGETPLSGAKAWNRSEMVSLLQAA